MFRQPFVAGGRIAEPQSSGEREEKVTLRLPRAVLQLFSGQRKKKRATSVGKVGRREQRKQKKKHEEVEADVERERAAEI